MRSWTAAFMLVARPGTPEADCDFNYQHQAWRWVSANFLLSRCLRMGPPGADGFAHLTVVAPALRILRLLCTLTDVYAGDAQLGSDGGGHGEVDVLNWLCCIEALRRRTYGQCHSASAAGCMLLMMSRSDVSDYTSRVWH